MYTLYRHKYTIGAGALALTKTLIDNAWWIFDGSSAVVGFPGAAGKTFFFLFQLGLNEGIALTFGNVGDRVVNNLNINNDENLPLNGSRA